MGWNNEFKKSFRKMTKKNDRPGFIYVFSLGIEDLYKIGCTDDWQKRLYTLRSGNPKIKPLIVIFVDRMHFFESFTHQLLEHHWIEREIYEINPADLLDLQGYLSMVYQAFVSSINLDKFALPESLGVLENRQISKEFDERWEHLKILTRGNF